MPQLIDFMRGRWSIYNFLSRVYEREISETLLKGMVGENSSIEHLRGLGDLIRDEYRNVVEAFNDLKEHAKMLMDDIERNMLKLAEDYAYLFLGVGRLPHPSESSYLSDDSFIVQEPRDEVLNVYRSVDVQKSEDYSEPEDHIAVELQFMAYLCRRSIEAFATGREDEGKKYLELQKNFFHSHLLAWVPKLTKNILEKAGTDFYKIVARITEEFVKSEKNTVDKLINLTNVCFNGASFEEFTEETLLKPIPIKDREKSEVKSYYKLLGLCGVAQGGSLVRVDVKDGRILRIRPVHYNEKYTSEELENVRWKVDARGKTFESKMRELVPPFALVYKNRVYSPNRVRYPLKRADWDPKGERHPENRGKSGYIRISWDEALDIIADEIKRIKDKYGSTYAILALADGHQQTKFVQGMHGTITELLVLLGGCTWSVRNPDSWEGWWWGAKHMWGMEPDGLQRPQRNVLLDILENTEVLLCWGCDYETTTWGFGDQGFSVWGFWFRDVGIKQIFICPDLNYAAAVHANKWIPIRPNTDAALQLAIAYVWISEETYDKNYVATHTVGFEKFRDYVLGKEDGIPKTPKWAEEITGVPARIIKALARLWASRPTSIIHVFGGPYIRGPYATEPARLEVALLAMQGIGKPGVHQLHNSSCCSTDTPFPKPLFAPFIYSSVLGGVYSRLWFLPYEKLKEWYKEVLKQFVPKTLVHEAILNPPISFYGICQSRMPVEEQFIKYKYPADGLPEVHMIWNEDGCLITCWNRGYKIIEAYRSPKIEFILAQHPWLENDCLFADIILPVTTKFEEEDIGIIGSAWSTKQHFAVVYEGKCIEPIGESKSDREIILMIAKKLEEKYPEEFKGLYEKLTEGKTTEDAIREAFEISGAAQYISFEELKERGYWLVPTDPEWKKYKPGLREFYEDPEKYPLQTPSGKIEFYSERLAKHFPDDNERPPMPRYIPYGESHQESLQHPRAEKYPFLLVSNHPRWRMHAQLDDAVWLREIPTCKIRGSDGYLYEPVWINPIDAEKLGVKTGDIVKIYNERGSVLGGAYVTNRIMPGVVYIDHGARADIISLEDRIDRGGAIDLIAPDKTTSKNAAGMVVSGYLVKVEKVDLNELKKKYPETLQRIYYKDAGLCYESYVSTKNESVHN
ncbi:MAG: molybdopterin-dependent oxidoreductase [Candidatus Bathyarchaeia archaeon]